MSFPRISQPPGAARFVQNPWPFYERARKLGPLVWWEEYGLPCALSHAAVSAILRDRRFGRETPEELRAPVPDHLAAFHALEDHSMLELEPPRHTRLRGLVLRAFTSRRIAAMGPEIAGIANGLLDRLPHEADLIAGFAAPLPVTVIARLLGVPESHAPDLLGWSQAMVAMYQAGRDRAVEDWAEAAARDFAAFLRGHIDYRRTRPGDDLITHLIAAGDEEGRLSPDETISTCILLLNAGHGATVHTLGNGIKALLEHPAPGALAPDNVEATVEEILRFDPPLHLFARWAYEDVEVMGHRFRRGERVACLLAAAGRDPGPWDRPARFDPFRPAKPHLAFGAGLHFCVGAPLARLELQTALPLLFARFPGMRLTGRPRYADSYHFRGLERLMVETGPVAR